MQYWQGVHYREQMNDSALAAWNDNDAPFVRKGIRLNGRMNEGLSHIQTSWTPQPRAYQPVSLARHVWKSLESIYESNHDQTYLNTTGQVEYPTF